jgi:Peptidase propeptide and YPEB domain
MLPCPMSSRHATARGVRPLPGLLAVAVALATSLAAAAVPAPSRPVAGLAGVAAEPPPGQGATLSLDRAVAAAQKRYRARVVRASTEEANGHRVYVLRLLSEEGRVWTVHVDALTGVMN